MQRRGNFSQAFVLVFPPLACGENPAQILLVSRKNPTLLTSVSRNEKKASSQGHPPEFRFRALTSTADSHCFLHCVCIV